MKNKPKYLKKKSGKNRRYFLAVLVIAVVVLLGCLVWLYFRGDVPQAPAEEPSESIQTENRTEPVPSEESTTPATEPVSTQPVILETEEQTAPTELNEQIDQEACQLIGKETDKVYGKIRINGDQLVLMGAADFGIETEAGTEYVTYLYLDETCQMAAEQLVDQQVSIRISRILRTGDTYTLSAEFFEADEILIPMEGLVARFPAQWGDYLKVTASAENAAAGYQFSCIYEGETYRLFDVLFGSAEGHGIGIAEFDGISMDATVVFYDEFTALDDQTGSTVYYGMLDAFQDVYESLKKCEGFSA